MRFDWYATSIPGAEPMVVVETLRKEFGGKVEEGRRRLGYAQAFRVLDKSGDELLAEVLVGAVNGSHDPHAVATGSRAHDFAQVVREHWPTHRVSRFDAAEDFDQDGAFETLTGHMAAISKEAGCKGLWMRPDDPEDGATYYLGSKASSVRCRAYQKGLLTRKEIHPNFRDQVSPHWARLEVQVRPQKQGKDYAATCSPVDAWGFALWSKELAQVAMALDVARYQGGWKPQTDDERAFDWMLRQYGPLLGRVKDDLGDWGCVGLQIGQRLKELSEVKP